VDTTRPAETPRTTPRETIAQTPTQVDNPTRRTTPDEKTRARIQDLLDRIQDAYFDYDKHDIRSDAQKTLSEDAHALTDILKDYPDYKLTVEGYCDERGSDEYNLALGDARAKQAKEFLVGLGIPSAQLKTVSYGKAKPVCTDENEGCWQKNRRAHITQEQS
jgi:peptidoglycan-associated lipoprotein